MKHPHAELMALYAQDAMTTDKPWELWELCPFNGEKGVDLIRHPEWRVGAKYRRKPVQSDLEKYGLKTGDVWFVSYGEIAYRVLIIAQSPRKNTCTRCVDIGNGEEVSVVFEEMECALYFRVGEVYKL